MHPDKSRTFPSTAEVGSEPEAAHGFVTRAAIVGDLDAAVWQGFGRNTSIELEYLRVVIYDQ